MISATAVNTLNTSFEIQSQSSWESFDDSSLPAAVRSASENIRSDIDDDFTLRHYDLPEYEMSS